MCSAVLDAGNVTGVRLACRSAGAAGVEASLELHVDNADKNKKRSLMFIGCLKRVSSSLSLFHCRINQYTVIFIYLFITASHSTVRTPANTKREGVSQPRQGREKGRRRKKGTGMDK